MPASQQIEFKDRDTYPVLSVHTSENGPKVFLGYRETSTYPSGKAIDPQDFRESFGASMVGNKAIEYHFDTETLKNSKLAQAAEGSLADPESIAWAISKFASPSSDSFPLRADFKNEDGKFSEYDRAAIKATQLDLKNKGYSVSGPNMIYIEKVSRELGNAPSAGYPSLDKADNFKAAATGFYNGLSEQQKSLFVDPCANPRPEFEHIAHGDGGSIMPNRHYMDDMDEWRHYMDDMDEWEQKEANRRRFENSLTPEQLAKWKELQATAEKEHYNFEKPKDGIPSAPDAKPSSSTLTKTFNPNALPSTPKIEFEHYRQEPGHYTFEPNVLKAQELMKKLQEASPHSGIDLGNSGANKNGLDGKFGPQTFRSVIATEKLLGVDPPSGGITPEFMRKLEEKAAALPTLSNTNILPTLTASSSSSRRQSFGVG